MVGLQASEWLLSLFVVQLTHLLVCAHGLLDFAFPLTALTLTAVLVSLGLKDPLEGGGFICILELNPCTVRPLVTFNTYWYGRILHFRVTRIQF